MAFIVGLVGVKGVGAAALHKSGARGRSCSTGCAVRSQRAVVVKMVDSAPAATGMAARISISGNNLDLTEALKEQVREKVGRVIAKHDQMVIKVDVHLEVAKNPSVRNGHTAEVVVQVKGNVVRAEAKSENMYASIDVVADKLGRTLRKYKERRTTHEGPKLGDVMPASDDESDFEDLVMYEPVEGAVKALSMIERATVPTPPLTLQEAATCLAFEKSFYMFRSAETGKICVIHKLADGGIGLIEPE